MGPTQGIYCTVPVPVPCRTVPYLYKQYVSTIQYCAICTVVYRITWYGSVPYVATCTLCFLYKVTILLALSCTLEVACKLKAVVVMCREWSRYFFACGSGGGAAAGDGRLLPIPLMLDVVIFGFRKRNARCTKVSAYAATANYPRAPSRSSQKINDGKYNGILLLLPPRKRNR